MNTGAYQSVVILFSFFFFLFSFVAFPSELFRWTFAESRQPRHHDNHWWRLLHKYGKGVSSCGALFTAIKNNTTEQLLRAVPANATNVTIQSLNGGFVSGLHPNFCGPAAVLPHGCRAYCDNVPKYVEWLSTDAVQRHNGVLGCQAHFTTNFGDMQVSLSLSVSISAITITITITTITKTTDYNCHSGLQCAAQTHAGQTRSIQPPRLCQCAGS